VRSNNFPQKGRGLGHVTPKICGKRSIPNILKIIWATDFKFAQKCRLDA